MGQTWLQQSLANMIWSPFRLLIKKEGMACPHLCEVRLTAPQKHGEELTAEPMPKAALDNSSLPLTVQPQLYFLLLFLS